MAKANHVLLPETRRPMELRKSKQDFPGFADVQKNCEQGSFVAGTYPILLALDLLVSTSSRTSCIEVLPVNRRTLVDMTGT